jgi:HAE1 family hydrophobic/amphiphilic exporter-1
VVSILGFVKLPTGFVPQEDEGYAVISVQLPEGASLHRTQDVVARADEIIRAVPGVDETLGISGYSMIDSSAGSNKGSLFVTFKDWANAPTPTRASRRSWRRSTRGSVAFRRAGWSASSRRVSRASAWPAASRWSCRTARGVGLNTLEQVTNSFTRAASGQSTIAAMFSSYRANSPQLFVEVDREQAQRLGVPLGEVFGALQAYLGSAYVNDFIQFGRIFQVKAQADAAFRATPEDILRLDVRSATGAMVPLGSIVSIEEVLGPQIVTHHNIYPSAKVNGFTPPGVSSGEAMETVRQLAASQLPPSVGYEWTDLSYQEDQASGSRP